MTALRRATPRASVTPMGDDGVTSPPFSATWATIGAEADDAACFTRFASSRGLTQVFLVVPTSPTGSPTAGALHVAAPNLHSEGIRVAAVADRVHWALDPRPFMRWIRRVRGPAGETPEIDAVHLDVEPWRLRVWDRDRLRATRGLVELLRLARAAVPDLPLSADLPHWLAGEPYWPPPTGVDPTSAETPRPSHAPPATGAGAPSSRGRIRLPDAPAPTGGPRRGIPASGQRDGAVLPPALPGEPGLPGGAVARIVEPRFVAAPRRSQRSVFDEALRHLDAVTILVPRTRTHGPGGILDASARARGACALRGTPYLIGVEARPRGAAHVPRPTFHDEGATALLREADRLAEALADDALFRGVAVRDWEAWSGLGG